MSKKVQKKEKICYNWFEVRYMDMAIDTLYDCANKEAKKSKARVQNMLEIRENDNFLISNIKFGINIHRLKKQIRRMNFSKYISINKEIANGKPVIKGTRITIRSINDSMFLHAFELSDNKTNTNITQLIKKDYPTLTEPQIIHALFYYINNTNTFMYVMRCVHQFANR